MCSSVGLESWLILLKETLYIDYISSHVLLIDLPIIGLNGLTKTILRHRRRVS